MNQYPNNSMFNISNQSPLQSSISNFPDNTFIIGDYIVYKKRIGKGSFSTIYKGYNKYTKREVAVKKMTLNNLGKLSTNMKREIRLMKNMKHSNIVELYDVIFDYNFGNIYLVMEFCNKGDFSKFQMKRAIREIHVKEYMRQLASGLKYLLKPCGIKVKETKSGV